MNMPQIPPENQRKLLKISYKHMLIHFAYERLFTGLMVLVQMLLWIEVFNLEIKSWWWFVAWYVTFDVLGIFRQWVFFTVERDHQMESAPYLVEKDEDNRG